jgi:RNA polymerase sigma-70 factor (ECF subfamily)
VSEDSTESAIARARSGDERAFEEVFRAWEPDVSRLCRRLLGHREAAEDAVHEVFLRVRRGLDDYDPARPFRPWLLGIASHHCIDLLRRRRTEERLFDADLRDPDDLPDAAPSPLVRLAHEEDRRALSSAIDALPPRYRLPLVLRYFNDLDYAAIAETLDVTRNQVATLLFRARRQLRARMAERGATVVPIAGRHRARKSS